MTSATNEYTVISVGQYPQLRLYADSFYKNLTVTGKGKERLTKFTLNDEQITIPFAFKKLVQEFAKNEIVLSIDPESMKLTIESSGGKATMRILEIGELPAPVGVQFTAEQLPILKWLSLFTGQEQTRLENVFPLGDKVAVFDGYNAVYVEKRYLWQIEQPISPVTYEYNRHVKAPEFSPSNYSWSSLNVIPPQHFDASRKEDNVKGFSRWLKFLNGKMLHIVSKNGQLSLNAVLKDVVHGSTYREYCVVLDTQFHTQETPPDYPEFDLWYNGTDIANFFNMPFPESDAFKPKMAKHYKEMGLERPVEFFNLAVTHNGHIKLEFRGAVMVATCLKVDTNIYPLSPVALPEPTQQTPVTVADTANVTPLSEWQARLENIAREGASIEGYEGGLHPFTPTTLGLEIEPEPTAEHIPDVIELPVTQYAVTGETVKIQNRIETLKQKVARLEQASRRPRHYISPFEAGGESYKMGKKLDAENERFIRVFNELEQAKRELKYLEIRWANYLSGECHLNGQPKKNGPSKKKKASNNEKISSFLKAHIKKGDKVGLSWNSSSRLTVKSVNQKTITDAHGDKWSYDEIYLLKDNEPYSDNELKELLREWCEKNEQLVTVSA